MTYHIGYRGCQHLGYAARNMRMHNDTGWNLRVVDGHVAHELTMRDMLAAGVSGVFDGGDIAHWSQPENRDINHMRVVDDLRVEAVGPDGWAPWYRGNTGNHDVGAVSAISAASALHRPALEAQVVYPGNQSTAGPLPGLYEVHQPDPTVPLYLHVVSHNGLLAGQGVNPEPIPGGVNLLSAHGIFTGDPRQRDMLESHGEQRVVPTSWVDRGWDAVLLSDLHTLGPVPGYGPADRDRGQVWYTGSAVRRGFSDAVGPRGWLLVTLHDDGTVAITARPVWQRPQHELPVINAVGLTTAEVDEQVTAHLGASSWWDPVSAELTGDGGYILRQRITGVSPSLRRSLNGSTGRWADLAKGSGLGAAWWDVPFESAVTATSASSTGQRTVTNRISDFSSDLADRVGGTGKVAALVAGIAPQDRDDVISAARAYLSDASQPAGDSADTAAVAA